MNDELQALRRVAQVLACITTPIERQNIARRVAQKAKGDDSELAFSLPHVAALFWPGNTEKTAQTLQQITKAFDAGQLGGFVPKAHRHILLTELLVWPDCPPMAADSPLRYWVPDAPEEAPQAAAAGTAKKWTPEALLALAGYREKHGTKKAAVHFQITEQRIRKLLPSEEKAPEKSAGYSVFSHRIE